MLFRSANKKVSVVDTKYLLVTAPRPKKRNGKIISRINLRTKFNFKMETMETDNGIYITELLTINDVRNIFKCVMDGSKREQICQRLSKSIFFNKGKFYNYNPILRVFKVVEMSRCNSQKEQLKFILSEFLDYSVILFSHTSDEETRQSFEALRNEFESEYVKLTNNKFVKNLEFYMAKLSRDDLNFDSDKYSIHFKNGRFNLKDGTFTQLSFDGRTKDMLVLTYLPYDYTGFAEGDLNMIDTHLSKCFPEPEAYAYIKRLIGKSLVADTKDCEFLINWGRGGAGKSMLLDMLSECFIDGVYVYRASSQVFSSEQEMKMSFRNFSPAYRFILVEELDKDGMKATGGIKRLCDGSITFRQPGAGEQITEIINAKIIATSNHKINFDTDDGGILRRATFYEYKCRFTSNPYEVNEATLTFMKDSDYIQNKIPDSSQRKSAIFSFFARETYHFINSHAPFLRPSCILSGLDLPSWKSFVDTRLIRHTNGSGRISKQAMNQLCNSYFTTQIPEKTMIRELNVFQVVYNKNGDEKGCRGVFTGVSPSPAASITIPFSSMAISGGGGNFNGDDHGDDTMSVLTSSSSSDI